MPTVASLDRRIRARHLLTHPFYVAWGRGEVPLETLREYAGQYYQFERNFPRYVAGAYARVTDPSRRRTLFANLVDEEGRDPTHPELWLRFGESIGVPRKEAREARAGPATQRLLTNYERQTIDGDVGSALGALYAYESIFPEVAAEKSRGLRAHYGVRSSRAHEFFRVHSVADLEHAEAERRLLNDELANSRAAARSAVKSVDATVDAWWRFLDAFSA